MTKARKLDNLVSDWGQWLANENMSEPMRERMANHVNNNADGMKALFTVITNLMAVKNDIMTMKKLDNGLTIRAGSEIHLKPGGYHLMFINLNDQVKITNNYKVNLIFKNSGSLTIDMPVLEKKFKADNHRHNHKH